MNYIITNFNKERSTVSLTVTWDDGDIYDKTMMADLSSEESIRSAIEKWLAEYAPMREAEKNSYDPSSLVDTQVDFTSKELIDLKEGKVEEFKAQPVKVQSSRIAPVQEVG